MKTCLSIILILVISSCSKIPAPSILAPSENKSMQKVSFGDKPTDYQNILKNYLITNLKNYKTAKVEFINEPNKISISHLGDDYSGYRVCLSINEKKGEYYVGYRNHFFLIKNKQVDLHLYDSGLLTIPFEYCVSRNIDNEYFIDDIPDNIEAISVESMDKVEIASKENIRLKKLQTELEILKEENKKLKKLEENKLESDKKNIEDIAKLESSEKFYSSEENIYISCNFNNKDITYIFNVGKETFKLIDKLDIVSYVVSFNEAYIVASKEALELTINRVTGKATLQDKKTEKGLCKLTSKIKF
jgi:hypothetical protein